MLPSPFARAVWFAALAILPVVLTGCGDGKPAAKPPAPTPRVEVTPVRSETVSIRREYVGTVAAYRSVQMRARVEGILEKRHYVEGTDVKRGQLLYTIDPLTYEAQLRDAEAELARSEAALSNARTLEERLGPLVQEEAIAKQDYDNAVSQAKQAKAQVDSARANLERARLNLGYTRVVATEAGRIGSSLVPEGALVGRGEPTLLATIDQLDPIYVTFTVTDRDMLAFRKAVASGAIKEATGDTARILLPDGSEFQRAGRIDFAETQVNPQTGTVTVRVVMRNHGEVPLLPGMFVRVELLVGSRPHALLVPQRAVVQSPTGHVVYVVTPESKIERRDVLVGEWSGADWIIEKGLAAGEKVVVDGVQRVQPGMTVQAVPHPGTGAAGTTQPHGAPAAAPSPAK